MEKQRKHSLREIPFSFRTTECIFFTFSAAASAQSELIVGHIKKREWSGCQQEGSSGPHSSSGAMSGEIRVTKLAHPVKIVMNRVVPRVKLSAQLRALSSSARSVDKKTHVNESHYATRSPATFDPTSGSKGILELRKIP